MQLMRIKFKAGETFGSGKKGGKDIGPSHSSHYFELPMSIAPQGSKLMTCNGAYNIK